MYCLYLLALFLLLGVDGKRSNSQVKSKNDATTFEAVLQNQGNSSRITADLVLAPKQMHELENALNNVVSKLLGPQQGQLSLRATENENSGLINTLKVVSDSICRETSKLFGRLGLIRPTKFKFSNDLQTNNPTLKSAVYHQLLRVPLILSTIFRQVHNQMSNHFRKNQYIKMGYKSSKLELQMDYGISTDELKLTSILGAMAKYGSNFYNCLNEKEPTSFDLKKALGELTNCSPQVTGRKLRSRLEKPIPKCPGKNKEEYNQFHAFVCHAVAEYSRHNYRDCLVEVRRIDKCVHKKLNGSIEVTEPMAKSSKDFVRTIESLDGSCKNADKGMSVLGGCKLKTKTKATRGNEFPYIVDFFMGDLKKSPKLGRMAKEVGSIITKSRVGSEAMNEVVTLIEIYKHGLEKKERLMKTAQRDVHQVSIFTRISDILTQYKQHILDVTYKTVSHINNVMTTVQKILVDSASTLVGQNLSANIKTMKCWSGFVDSVVVDWTHNRSHFPLRNIARKNLNSEKFGNGPKRSRSKGLIVVPNEVDFIKSPHEEPLNKLIVSMKNLGQPIQPRRSTALMSLANTFLLATMFYECISLLAGAIYREEDTTSMSPSINAEIEEPDPWQSPRDRRSSLAIDNEDFQPRDREDQEDPLLITNETDKATAPTVKPDRESIQESVNDIETSDEIHTEHNHQQSS